MTTMSQSPLQLLILGVLLLVSPVYLQQPPACEVIRNTVTHGSYNLDVSPLYYKPGAIYTVTITGIENGTSLILQALSSDESSSGLWEGENHPITCSDAENLVQKNISGSGARTRWTSPTNTNVVSAQIRAFVSFANGTTLLQTRSLAEDLTTAASTPSTASQPTSDSHHTILHSNTTNSHMLHNSTVVHPNLASSHQWTKGPPHSGVSVAQASSVLLALLQFLSISLGYKLLC